jgi:RNA polymerase sigma factor (sigma-70 family)
MRHEDSAAERTIMQLATRASSPARLVRTLDIGDHDTETPVHVIVTNAIGGSQEAWGSLSRRYGAMIRAIAYGAGLKHADVSEVCQTTWLRLVENIDRLERRDLIGAWIATTARRESVRVARGLSRCSFEGASFDQIPDVDAPAPEAGPLVEERDAALRVAFGKLPPRCQQLLGLLIEADSPSYREIAAALDMPIGSIGPTRGRCLEHLRRIMSPTVLTALNSSDAA